MRWKLLLIAAVCCWSLGFAKSPIPEDRLFTSEDATHCFFIPPQGWELADPKTFAPSVRIAFLKHSDKGFCPSINLAIEETHVSLNDYLKAVKAIHQQDRNNQWRALGKVRTPAGLAQLTEISSKTELGPIRILQLIFMKDDHAYVVTAAALKEEFSDYYKDFQTAFRSLTLTTDLIGNVPQLERRESLKEKQHQLIQAAQDSLAEEQTSPLETPAFLEKYWQPFQQSVIENFEEMGAFWQILFLRSTQLKLLSLSSSDDTDRQNSTAKIQ